LRYLVISVFQEKPSFLLLLKVQLEFSTVSECVPLTERSVYQYRQGIRRNAGMAAAVPRTPGTISRNVRLK
jgi:hypothetical protein